MTNVELRIRHLDVPDLIAAAWRRRTMLALDNLTPRLRRVTVTLEPQADSAEVMCRVRVEGHDGFATRVTARKRDAGHALAVALDRVARAAWRHVERRRLKSRRAS